MKLVHYDFAFKGPFGPDMSTAMEEMARSIAQEPGMIWKIWTENQAAGEAGGIYLFTDEQSAKSFIKKHLARLEGFGIHQVNVKIFDVNVPLTRITRGPVSLEQEHPPLSITKGVR